MDVSETHAMRWWRKLTDPNKVHIWGPDQQEGTMYEIKTEETFERTYSYDPGNTLLGMDDHVVTDKLVRKAATENPSLLVNSEGRPTGKTEEHITEIWRDGVRIYPRKVRSAE